MQWKIAVDDDTYRKWKNVDFKHKSLSSYTAKVDGARVIRLNNEKLCPFLSENGLCKLVMEHGDEMLSNTCNTFPRQVHDFGNRKEYSVVSCCPEVIDMMYGGKISFSGELAIDGEDYLTNVRNLMIWLVSNEDYPLKKAVLMAAYVLYDIHEKEPEDLRQYTDKKALDELYEGICKMDATFVDTFCEDNELWLDVVENYRKEGLYRDYIEEISQVAEKILEDFEPKNVTGYEAEWKGVSKKFGEYEGLFRNYIVAELFSNMLIPDSDLESLVVSFQWIMMEYVVIRQGIYLKMKSAGKMPEYAAVRDYIVVISRMTGYDFDDIYEYMENSFQNVIWQWFYAALIIGI